MFVQITVFIENKPGRLTEVTGCLAAGEINIHALSVADTADFGILRMIVSNPVKAERTLKDNGYMVKTTNVIAVALGNSPGSLYKVLAKISALGISIEYMYAFMSKAEQYEAVVIMRLENQEDSADKLKEHGITVLGREFLDQLNTALL